MRELLRIALTQHGHHLFSAEDRATCLAMLKQHKIDLVVLDLRIPG
ncbi:MAG TPA: hypothetical protein DCR55_07335 [Lentisphaeria bacterium]|nr:hypothetical protein [Lentisphaeria bacterium]